MRVRHREDFIGNMQNEAVLIEEEQEGIEELTDEEKAEIDELLKDEQWALVPGSKRYWISSFGRVVATTKDKAWEVKPSVSNSRAVVTLCEKRKNKTLIVARLVAEVFLGMPDDRKFSIYHEDDDVLNTSAKNVEVAVWGHTKHGKRAAKARKKRIMCVETGRIYDSLSEARDDTGINITSLSFAIHGKFEAAGGLHWKLVDEKEENREHREVGDQNDNK